MDDDRTELESLVRALRDHVAWQTALGQSGAPQSARGSTPEARGSSATLPSPGAPRAAGSAPSRADAPAPQAPAARAPLPPALPEAERTASLRVLSEQVSGCTRCRLHEGRTQTVFGVGSPMARLCFVGEGPGRDEDQRGEPFVGRAGQLLTRMIKAMGLAREDVYICNVVKCRPPENRTPLPDEMSTCGTYLERQLELCAPEVIVALGTCAARQLLSTMQPMSRLRGTFHEYRGVPVMPTYHPAYLLRNEEAKRPVWEDLQKVMTRLGLKDPRRAE